MTSMLCAIHARTSSISVIATRYITPQLQSSCSTMPASTIASYSTRIASAIAVSNSSSLA